MYSSLIIREKYPTCVGSDILIRVKWTGKMNSLKILHQPGCFQARKHINIHLATQECARNGMNMKRLVKRPLKRWKLPFPNHCLPHAFGYTNSSHPRNWNRKQNDHIEFTGQILPTDDLYCVICGPWWFHNHSISSTTPLKIASLSRAYWSVWAQPCCSKQ